MLISLALGLLLGSAAPLFAQRLPDTVRPEHYALSLTPDLDAEIFTGEVRIDVRLTKPSSKIVLNAVDLSVARAQVEVNGSRMEARVAAGPEREQITVETPREVPAGPAVLTITFSGRLNDQLRGFYISRTPRRKYASTQFESTDARRAYPCFDEPAFKATFDVTATVASGDMAISNAPVASDEPAANGRHTVRFERTPRMSSYLVALAVGDFSCREGRAGDVPIRVCAIPEKASLTGFGLEAAEHIVPFFSNYYGIPYPFKKLDVVAVPDFAAGAMENTGAIFYRESALLVDEQRSSRSALKSIAAILSHEIAHQWFGDLVTMRWWDDTWLNEGFASWAANKPLEGWRGWSFAADEAGELREALATDQLASSHAVHNPAITDPAAIEANFDSAITYSKSAAILRMVEQFLGPEMFRRGVSAYLERFSYGNASAADFWNTLSTISGKPVDRIMSGFVNQPGVPEVSVAYRCEDGRTQLALEQQRFLLNAKARSDTRWTIPVCLARPAAGDSTCEVLDEPRASFALPGCGPWLFANDDGRGYYRTRYDREGLKALVASGLDALSPVERGSLVSDQWALARQGTTGIDDYLALVRKALEAPDEATIETIAPSLEYVNAWLVRESEQAHWRSWVRKVFSPRYERLGWEPHAGEPASDTAIRPRILELLGRVADDPQIQDEAVRRVRGDLEGHELPPSIAEAAYSIAAARGGATLYDAIRQSLTSALPPALFYRRQFALAQFADPALVRRTFEYALSDSARAQDAPILIAVMLGHPQSAPTAWDLLKSRWTEVRGKLDAPFMSSLVEAPAFCSADRRADVGRFFTAHPVPGMSGPLALSLERIESCTAMRQTQGAALARAVE